jgi:hypothetical protein
MDLQAILATMSKGYSADLKIFYPAQKSNGFAEANLTARFSRAVCGISPEAVVWYELPIPKDAAAGDSQNRIDACIIFQDKKEIYLIESKRFNIPDRKKESVRRDVTRLKNVDVKARFGGLSGYAVYGIIIADVWTRRSAAKKGGAGAGKRDILDNWGERILPEIKGLPDLQIEKAEKVYATDNYYYNLLALSFKQKVSE